MIVLVANLGSTSFKYKLFDMVEGREAVLAQGAADRIGPRDQAGGDSAWKITAGGETRKGEAPLANHAAAIDLHLAELKAMGVTQAGELSAIGFKAVHGGPIAGAVRVDDDVLATMEAFVPLAPAHNPPYIAAMRSFRQKLPGVEQVAAFETAFHATMPEFRRVYGVPYEWATEHGVRRYGFHGASHRYIATRVAELGKTHGFVTDRLVSLHLGGSCSVCAIERGRSVAHSMGTTPQTGLFHSNRVGDFDPFALKQLEAAGVSIDDAFAALGGKSGLLGLSGVSGDARDVEEAADAGNAQAKLALDAFVDACRHYVGAYLAVLGGADAVVFTAGIGQHGATVRAAVCDGFAYAGLTLDASRNAGAPGDAETRISADGSAVQAWVVPTDEELIVARQTVETLRSAGIGV